MADGRRREAWAHTSSLMALVANANRNEKKRSKPFDADDFNPYSAKRGPATFEIGKDIAWDDFARMMSGVKPKPPC